MPRHSPYTITLSRDERGSLESLARQYTLPYCQVLRARIVLAAAEGLGNDQIAATLSVGRDVVTLWRKRSFSERLAGLDERPRSGRPRACPPRGRRSGQSPGV